MLTFKNLQTYGGKRLQLPYLLQRRHPLGVTAHPRVSHNHLKKLNVAPPKAATITTSSK